MRSSLILIALTFVAGSSVRAAQIIYDPFLTGSPNYTVGAVLNGQNPAIANTTAAWATNGTGTSSSTSIRASATGLSYFGLPVAGGSAEAFRTGATSVAGTFLFDRPTDTASANTLINSTDALYFSALMQYNATSTYIGLSLQFEGMNRFGIGITNAGQVGIMFNPSSSTPNFVATTAGSPLSVNTTYMLVGRMIPNGLGLNDTIEILALNPILANPEPVSPLLSHASSNVWAPTNDNLSLYGIVGNKPAAESITGTIDEIRIGTTWNSVVGVPEPSSIALGAIASLSMLGFAARRRRITR